MTLRVEIWGMENGEDTFFGDIILADGVFTCVPELPVLEDLLENPLWIDGDDVYAQIEPERFIKNMYRHYRGVGKRASRPMELVQ